MIGIIMHPDKEYTYVAIDAPWSVWAKHNPSGIFNNDFEIIAENDGNGWIHPEGDVIRNETMTEILGAPTFGFTPRKPFGRGQHPIEILGV